MPKLKNENTRPYIAPLLIALLQCIQLQISTLRQAGLLMFIFPKSYLSIAILFCFVLLLGQAKKRWPLYAGCVFMTLFSIANYFTCKFHQSPLFYSTMKNIGTAMRVAGGYNYRIDIWVSLLLALMVIETWIIRKAKEMPRLKSTLIITACIFMITVVSLQIMPYTWAPSASVCMKGFPVAFLQSLTAKREVIKPEYYMETGKTRGSKGSATPDIILILNETYSTLDTQGKLAEQDDVITGKAIVANVGGGTNDSEYELLTSYSTSLFHEHEPYNFLSDEALGKSTVAHLKSLGYETSALHCGHPQNYNRETAYPLVGFDNIYLGKSHFTLNANGNRQWLDSDNYKDMLGYCKPKEGDPPQLIYLLTYQNHGGYEQNDSSLDTVHATGYGEMNDEVSEYLSSTSLSDDAFLELVDQFKGSDRPTIIFMVGDHAPSFISEIETDEIKKRQVDYAFWANYDIDFEGGDLTMTDIMPVIMKDANITTTDYLDTVYEAHRQFPARTTTNILIDKKGIKTTYDGTQEIVNEYFSKEYDQLKEK